MTQPPTRGPRAPWPLLRALMRDLTTDDADVASRMAERIRSEVPYYRERQRDVPRDLAGITSAHLRYAVDRMSGDSADDVPYAIGHARGASGVPLATVLAAYRVGVQFLWERVARFAQARAGHGPDDLIELATEVWLLYDDYAQSLERGWHEARQAALQRTHQERSSLVDSILRSTGESPSRLWEAVDRLGLPRRGGYVVVVVRLERPGADPAPEAEKRLLAQHVASAWLVRADLLAGVVAVGAPDAESILVTELERARATAGISPRRDDYAEGAQAFRFAAAAAAASAPGTTTRFGAAPVAVTAAASPDIAREVAAEVLSAVLALPSDEADALIDTLHAWFAAAGSTADTAKTLFLHPNTVRNRLHRVEALTGRVLTAPSDIAEVAVALAGLRLP